MSVPGSSGPYFEPESPLPGFVDMSRAASAGGPMPVLATPGPRLPRPRRHAVWATVAVLVFPPTGLLALGAAFAVDDAVLAGDLGRARRRSRWVLVWGGLSWVCAVALVGLGVFAAAQLVRPFVDQVSAQWAGVSGAVSGVTGTVNGGSGLPGPSGGSLPLLPDALGVPGESSPRGLRAAQEASALVGRFEQAAGVPAGKVAPLRMWQEMRASGQAPDGQMLLQHGVVGIEVTDRGVWQVSVLSGSVVCVVVVDPSGSSTVVGAGSC